MKIFFANMPFDLTCADIRPMFEAFGVVETTQLIKDHSTGKSKGFGFIVMPNDEQAYSAMNTLNKTIIGSRKIVVQTAGQAARNKEKMMSPKINKWALPTENNSDAARTMKSV